MSYLYQLCSYELSSYAPIHCVWLSPCLQRHISVPNLLTNLQTNHFLHLTTKRPFSSAQMCNEASLEGFLFFVVILSERLCSEEDISGDNDCCRRMVEVPSSPSPLLLTFSAVPCPSTSFAVLILVLLILLVLLLVLFLLILLVLLHLTLSFFIVYLFFLFSQSFYLSFYIASLSFYLSFSFLIYLSFSPCPTTFPSYVLCPSSHCPTTFPCLSSLCPSHSFYCPFLSCFPLSSSSFPS